MEESKKYQDELNQLGQNREAIGIDPAITITNDEHYLITVARWLSRLSFWRFLGMTIIFGVIFLLSLWVGTKLTNMISKDANFVLTRDQVIKMAQKEPSCRQFNESYSKEHIAYILDYETVADPRGGLRQVTKFNLGENPDGGGFKEEWVVNITTHYLEQPFLFPPYLFDKSQVITCDKLH